MEVSLHVLAGKRKGHHIPLPPTLFVIGRDMLCHLRPHSALVSRRHCAIARWGDKILLRDLKSGNGTYLNEKKVEGEVRVKDGDTLQVGDLLFSFHIKEDGENPKEDVPEDAINWLIGVPADSAVLDPAESTVVVHLAEPEEQTEIAGGSKDLSAGKYLRDYLTEQQKLIPRSKPKPPVQKQ